MIKLVLLVVAIGALYLSGSLLAVATATAGLMGLTGSVILGSGPLAMVAHQLLVRVVA